MQRDMYAKNTSFFMGRWRSGLWLGLPLVVVPLLVPWTAEAREGKAVKPEKAAGKVTSKAAPTKNAAGEGALPDAFAQPLSGKEAKKETSETFEVLLKEAVQVKDFATLIEPLYAKCDESDPIYARQCELSKVFLLDYLRGHTFVAEADVPPETSPYDAAAKQIDMEISGCVVCKQPILVAGEPRFLTTKPVQRIQNGLAMVDPVASHEISIEDRTQADRFVEKVVPRLKVQHVFRFSTPYPVETGTGASSSVAPKGAAPVSPPVKGVLVASLGHRVYDRCTGQVAAASPKAGALVKVTPDRSCPRDASEEMSQAEIKKQNEYLALPERLSPREIDRVLAPIQARVHDCYVEFGEPSGNAKVSLVIGTEGKLTQIGLPPPFDKADIGLCLKSQIRSAVFPKFRGSPMKLEYVYQVQ
jgi:hypothetical protein